MDDVLDAFDGFIVSAIRCDVWDNDEGKTRTGVECFDGFGGKDELFFGSVSDRGTNVVASFKGFDKDFETYVASATGDENQT